MTHIINKLIVASLCEAIALFILSVLHRVEKKNIVEIGYRVKDKRNKWPKENRSFLNALLYWDLCKNAKYDKRIVWVYFGCNTFVCLCTVLSLTLCMVLAFLCKHSEILLYSFTFLILSVYIWGIVHLVLDLFFLPSERKRYGITGKRKRSRK